MQKIQHINRFYVSKQAPYLYKSKKTIKHNAKTGVTAENVSMESIIAGRGIQLFNTYEEKSMDDYKIDYSYYIGRAKEIVFALEPDQLKLF